MIRRTLALETKYKSSFFSYEKNLELIVKKLFVDNPAYAENLKRLLVINKPDCLATGNEAYNELIKGYGVGRLKKEGYIRTIPRLDLKEHEDIKSYIIIMMDDFTPTSNDKYRDCTITFFVFSEYDYAEMDNYEYRPIKIAGYIDGIMRDAKLAGIGKLQFLGAQQVPLNEYWGGMALMYITTHGEEEDSNPDINEAS
jgi:hypothetical protein